MLYDHAPTSSHSLDPEESFIFPVVTYNSSLKWTSRLLLLRTPPHVRPIGQMWNSHWIVDLQPTSGETLRHLHPDNGLEIGQAVKQEPLPPKRFISLHLLSRCSGKNQTPGCGSLSFSDRRQAPSIYLAVSQSPVAKLPSWPETDQKSMRDSNRDQKSYPTSLV